MYNRRQFLGAIGLPAVAAAAGAPFAALRGSRAAEIAKSLAEHPGSPNDVARQEEFWFEVLRRRSPLIVA